MIRRAIYESAYGLDGHDARAGAGRGRTPAGALNSTYACPSGYPYDIDDVGLNVEYDEEDDALDNLGDKVARKLGRGMSSVDPTTRAMHDRRSQATNVNMTLGMSGGVAESSMIRLRSRSSEPGYGTMYGLSKAPIHEPNIRSSANLYRYDDIRAIADDEDVILTDMRDEFDVKEDEEDV